MTFQTLFTISLILYFASAFIYLGQWFLRVSKVRRFAILTLTGAVLLRTIIMLWRSIDSGYLFYNLQELLSIYPWALALLLLLVEWRFGYTLLGVMITPLSALLMLFSTLLPDAHAQLPSVLRSPVLLAHVGIFLSAYAAFTLAFTAAVAYLLQEKALRKKKLAWRLPPLRVMDKLSNNLVIIGSILMAIAIFLGSLWALTAWGRPWVWQPKQIMSLVTLVIYGFYFAMRYIAQWSGRQLAWLVAMGFISIMITFIGADLLAPQGIHSFLF